MEGAPFWEELVTIGRVARSQGRTGEVAVLPLTDFPERFRQLARVFIEGEGGRGVPLAVERAREQGGRPILKFQGVSTIGEAKRLLGRELRLPQAELVRLPAGSFYHFELRGLAVWDRAGGYLGVVEAILPTGGTDLLVVRGPSGAECLVPICEEICRVIDRDHGRIEIEAPLGLVTLNAN